MPMFHEITLLCQNTTNKSHLEQHHPQLSDQSVMKHYCAKPSGFNDWRSDMVAENK